VSEQNEPNERPDTPRHTLLDFAALLDMVYPTYPNQGNPLQEHSNPDAVPVRLPRLLVPHLGRDQMSEDEQIQRAIEESLSDAFE